MARVLITDDDDEVQNLNRETLELGGFHVSLASDGLEALSIIQESKIDLLLTDFKMPNMDGIELILELRSRGHLMPILLLTGSYEDFNVPGDVKVLRKPVPTAELLSVMNGLLKSTGRQSWLTVVRPTS